MSRLTFLNLINQLSIFISERDIQSGTAEILKYKITDFDETTIKKNFFNIDCSIQEVKIIPQNIPRSEVRKWTNLTIVTTTKTQPKTNQSVSEPQPPQPSKHVSLFQPSQPSSLLPSPLSLQFESLLLPYLSLQHVTPDALKQSPEENRDENPFTVNLRSDNNTDNVLDDLYMDYKNNNIPLITDDPKHFLTNCVKQTQDIKKLANNILSTQDRLNLKI